MLAKMCLLYVLSMKCSSIATANLVKHVQALPTGFLRVASGLNIPKLRTDYRHRLLSLCSDVGLSAESKSGRYKFKSTHYHFFLTIMAKIFNF